MARKRSKASTPPPAFTSAAEAGIEVPLSFVPSTPDTGLFHWRTAAAALVIFLAVVAIYAQVANYPFVSFDDPATVSANEYVAKGFSAEGITWAFTDIQTFYWQPLTWLSHMLDVQLFGMNAGPQHLVNVLFHGLNAVLLLLVLLRMTGMFWRSAIVAACFALHPLRVESVAWITERKDVLSSLFWLLSLWFYAAYAHCRSTRRNYLWAMLAGFAAMLSKPMAVTLPAAMLLLDFWPLNRWTRRGDIFRLVREKLPLLAMGSVGATLTLLGNADNSLEFIHLPLPTRVARFLASLADYVGKLFWPEPLCMFYPYEVPSLVGALLCALGLAAVLVSAALLRRRLPALLMGCLWFIVLLMPVSGIFQTGGQALADRFTYLPGIGLVIALVYGVGPWLESRPFWRTRVAAGAGVAILAALSFQSWRQVGTWQDSVTMYRHAVDVTRNNEPMMRNLALEMESRGMLEEGLRLMREAVRLEPTRAVNQKDLARLLNRANRPQEAIAALQRAVRQEPESVATRRELAMTLMRMGRTQEAVAEFGRLLKYAPNDMLARQMAGSAPPAPEPPAEEAPPEAPAVVNNSFASPEENVELWQGLLVIAALALALLCPGFGACQFIAAERFLSSVASRGWIAVLVAGALPLLLRLLLLPFYGAPQPVIADEFGYLLTADTFAHGRLTNPTHPMHEFFESSYILFNPTYNSYYPIGQSFLLMLPKVVGLDPWLGVWLSAALMCAALCWMLRAWLPPRWALLGALLAALQYTVLSNWMNSYWGGAVPALGGALALGALPRILRHYRVRDALWLSLGFALTSQSRPYESVALALPVFALLLPGFWRSHPVSLSKRLVRVVLPIAACLAVLVLGTMHYNRTVTGDPFKLPYKLYQEQWGMPTTFYWQQPAQETAILAQYPDIRNNYLWQRYQHNKASSLPSLMDAFQVKILGIWNFYIGPVLTLPFLMLPWLIRSRKLRPLFITGSVVLIAIVLYPFYFPHYMAPIAGVVLVALVQGLRHLRTWRWMGQPAGILLVGCVLVVSATTLLIPLLPKAITGAGWKTQTQRGKVIDALQKAGGSHLVLVRYRPDHDFHNGVIYNDADIDHSPIVWARDLGPERNRKLLNYFKGRQFWLMEIDLKPPRLDPYREETQTQPPAPAQH